MLKRLVLAAMLCAAPAYAKNIAAPDKNPVVTLSVPDNWSLEEIDYGWSAKSPDQDIFFSVEYASDAKLKKMSKNNAAWMKENNIKARAKPTDAEAIIAGMPAIVKTIPAKDDDGDTLVDFTIIPYPGGAIMLTLWASEAQRDKHKGELEAIENSIKPIAPVASAASPAKPPAEAQPAPTPAASAAPTTTAAPAASAAAAHGGPSLSEIDALQKAVTDALEKMPLTQRRAIFVSEKAPSFGNYKERGSNVFKAGEPIITYIEPMGYAWKTNGGNYDFGVSVDYVVKSADGKVLGGQENFSKSLLSSRAKLQEFMLTLTLTLDDAPAGNYILAYTLHDLGSSETSKIELPFSIAK